MQISLARLGQRTEWKVGRLINKSGSFQGQATAVFWCVLDGASVGGLSLGGAVAENERSRNSADAHGSASVERCQQAGAIRRPFFFRVGACDHGVENY